MILPLKFPYKLFDDSEQVPIVLESPYDPSYSLNLSSLNDFKDPELTRFTSVHFYEFESNISELDYIDISPEYITDRNIVTLAACEK